VDAGAVAYQEENYDKAFEEFSNALKVQPGDSLALLYAGSVAQENGDIDNALKMYETMVEVGNAPETVYSTIIYYYKAEKDDMESAMKFNDMAIKKFPENKSFVQEKIVYLITSGKSAEAEQHLLSEIELHPDDPILYFELGYLYDEQDNDDKALEAYSKAFEVDPTYYDAIFNYAIVHYNKAADIIKAFNDKPLGSNYNAAAYAKEEKLTMDKAAVHFKAALPYLEKAYELKPDDTKLLEILGGVYNQLGMDDKYDEISKKLEALESGE
jgi:tetratricopeptide (TPR) repeat protein